MADTDRDILRDLAKKYMEVCRQDVQDERRRLWRKHNSFQYPRPLIYVRAFAWREMPESQCTCEDAFYRQHETFFRQMLFRDTLNDDTVCEPWATVNAACVTPAEGIWGVPFKRIGSGVPHGAWRLDPPIKEEDDIKRVVETRHRIDEEETARRAARLHDAIGDIVPITVDRAPVYRGFSADISTHLIYLRGLEQVMWDMVDRPAWLHRLLALMRDGILRAQGEAEQAGDWALCDHQNQAVPYAEELEDPAADGSGVTRDMLWCFSASQETTLVGPAMFDEFMLQYQIPIMEKFGLSAYGCCEDLTQKIDVLRQIPNLRRIAIAPVADVAKCAEQIGTDYVMSYRPSPTDMVGYGLDADRVRGILKSDLRACRDCHVDITLKDVETVEGDPDRVRQWVKIARDVIEEVW